MNSKSYALGASVANCAWLEKLGRPITIFCVAMALRLLLLIPLGGFRDITLWESGEIVRNMLAGHGCSTVIPVAKAHDLLANPLAKPWPTSSQAPAYVYLLYGFLRLLGDRPFTYGMMAVAQCLIVSSIIFPVGWLTRRWFGRMPATWAMWLVCLAPYYLWTSVKIGPVALVVALPPWVLQAWLCFCDRGSNRFACLAGFGWGIAGLCQPLLLGVFGVYGAVLGVDALRRRAWAFVCKLVLVLAVCLLTLAPWTIRNYVVHGRWIPIKSSFPKELWIGNNPCATGTTVDEGGKTDLFWSRCAPKCLAKQGLVPEMEIMDELKAEALHYIRASPMAFVTRTLRKVTWFWTVIPMRFVIAGSGRQMFYWISFYWVAFVAFILLARVYGGRFHAEYRRLLWIHVVLYSAVYGLTHVGNIRYRAEMEYIMLPAVSMGLGIAWSGWRNRRNPGSGEQQWQGRVTNEAS